MNNIDQQLEQFIKSIIEIDNYQSFTKSLFLKLSIYEHENERNNIKERSEVSEADWSNWISFIYKDYNSGDMNVLKTSEFTINDSKRIEIELKNRQYQFLLLNAFEAFEQYLKCASLHIKYKKSEENFSPTKFIAYLHKTTLGVSRTIEIRNENNARFLNEINLLLTFSLIEQLRHQITHTSGYAKDKSLFIEKCLKRIGRFNNGKPKSEYTNYLNSFFGTQKYENLICLIEISDRNNSFFYYDRLGDLVKELASYILFIHGYIKRQIKEIQTTSEVAI